jgi:hypothetical protein
VDELCGLVQELEALAYLENTLLYLDLVELDDGREFARGRDGVFEGGKDGFGRKDDFCSRFFDGFDHLWGSNEDGGRLGTKARTQY